MPLELRKLELSDSRESLRMACRAHYAAGNLSIFCTPSGELHPDDLEKMDEKRRQVIIANEDRYCLMKVVDTDLDRMIAYASWEVDPNGRTQEQLDAVATPMPADPNAPVPKAWDDLQTYLCAARRKYLGLEPAVFLKGLICDTEHQRRGAGGMLLKWGTDKADELGIRCYLEATSAGAGLYAKHGFKVLYEQNFDYADYGASGGQTDYVMERPAKVVAA